MPLPEAGAAVIGRAPRGFARSFPPRSDAPPRAFPSRARPGGGRGAGGMQQVKMKSLGWRRRREGHGRGRRSCGGGDGGRPRRLGEAEGDQATRRRLPGRRRLRGRGVHAAETAGGRVRRSMWGGPERRRGVRQKSPVRRPEPQMARGGVETSSSPLSRNSYERGRRRSPLMAAAAGGAAARLERDGAAAHARSPHSPAGATDGLGRGRRLFVSLVSKFLRTWTTLRPFAMPLRAWMWGPH